MLGKLYMVGAGPGSPDLISLRGWRILQRADVVLYDALVDETLLVDCPANTIKVYVGKRGGKPSVPQLSINQLIVEYAQQYPIVVRLKGGDPFVFGRATEEIDAALQHGIAVELIPGISSALAVPALQGIPLTDRQYSTSFWVLTGTTAEGNFSSDLHLAAQSNATIIVLMGMNKLAAICQVLAQMGKEMLPVAIIQNGTLPTEKIVVGTVSNIVQLATDQQMASPAIIVLGDVVQLRHQMQTIQNSVIEPLP
jgi:uroporphyrin-III C-methyltransferase